MFAAKLSFFQNKTRQSNSKYIQNEVINDKCGHDGWVNKLINALVLYIYMFYNLSKFYYKIDYSAKYTVYTPGRGI